MPSLTAIAPPDKAAAIRIGRALGQPGAAGKRGVLLWIAAAYPRQIAERVIRSVANHPETRVSPITGLAGTGFGYLPREGKVGDSRPWRPVQGFGYAPRGERAGDYTGHPYQDLAPHRYFHRPVSGFGFLGDDSALSTPSTDTSSLNVSSDVQSAIDNADTSPPSTDWASAISSAMQAAGQLYLGVQQQNANSQIFKTNLALAQAGKPLIPTNPTQYGLPSPTLNVGLDPATQSAIWWIGGGVVVAIVLASLAKSRKH